MNDIIGAEGIVIHDNKIVLGMQKPKRWYNLENGEKAAIIKTIGGSIEIQDKGNSKKTLIRELLEEISGINKNDLELSDNPIFSVKAKMKELNPYEKNSNLNMEADFYLVNIKNNIKISPNDLSALIELPIDLFLKLDFAKNLPLSNIKDFLIVNNEIFLPKNYSILIPKEVKEFLKIKYNK